ncbi:hypothetical protein [Blastopirellula marina]|uniref:hypothetical protein n=1 Tax=Blastopirellula marina TaxID=124 RepID=UPI000320BD58|nr:hypothetical protein [Blastopirellula marina]
MISRSWIICVTLSVCISAGSTAAQSPSSNLDEAGKHIAVELVSFLDSVRPAVGKNQIGILAFGDINRIITPSMGDFPLKLQAQTIEHLIEQLINNPATDPLASDFDVFTYSQLEAVFSAPVSPSGLNDLDLTAARAALANFSQIDVAIVGHFEIDGKTLKPQDIGRTVSVSVTAFTATAAETFTFSMTTSDLLPTTPGGGPGPQIGDSDNNGNGRADVNSNFIVEFFAQPNGSSTFEQVPLKLVTDAGSPLFNTFLVVLDRDRFAGQRYKLRVKNRGGKPHFILPGERTPNGDGTVTVGVMRCPDPPTPNAEDRVYLLSSYVDGVSTINRRITNSAGGLEFTKDIRHQAFVGRRILTPPKKWFVREDGFENNRFKDAKLTPSKPGLVDHSEQEILAFLNVRDDGSQTTGNVFVLGDAQESVGAEFVSTGRNSIGIISLYFFAEKLPNETGAAEAKVLSENAATIAGPEIPRPVIRVGIKNVYPVPIETWHIRYMYDEGSGDVPPAIPIDLSPNG